jgi:hypothetical protein
VCIWHAFGLQPHREEAFKLSTDPLFIDKVRDVVGLYLAPPERELVLWVWMRRRRCKHWIARRRICRWAQCTRRAAPTTTCAMGRRPGRSALCSGQLLAT